MHAGSPVDEVSITLRIFGDDLDPHELTTLLGVEPASCCRKGDAFRDKGYDRTESTGRWLLMQPRVSGDMDGIIQRLLLALPDDPGLWKSLHARFSIDLFLGVWMNDWNRGFLLSRDTVSVLADRRLEVRFDIYCDRTRRNVAFHD